jgi:SAM-dependent methyltransferase
VRQRRLRVLTFLVMLMAPAFALAEAPEAPPVTPAAPAGPTEPAPPAEEKALDAPYAPTPHRVVTAMLEMATVTRKDVLYDLGSGDGRIVIAAAKRFGALGIGIDLNPKRIREAEFNARAAGAADRVEFVLGDIFDADLSPATVVTIYLLPHVNRRLLPKLLTELKPGTRIVSHNYGLGDWEPERHQIIDIAGTKHDVYLWTVPSSTNGKP